MSHSDCCGRNKKCVFFEKCTGSQPEPYDEPAAQLVQKNKWCCGGGERLNRNADNYELPPPPEYIIDNDDDVQTAAAVTTTTTTTRGGSIRVVAPSAAAVAARIDSLQIEGLVIGNDGNDGDDDDEKVDVEDGGGGGGGDMTTTLDDAAVLVYNNSSDLNNGDDDEECSSGGGSGIIGGGNNNISYQVRNGQVIPHVSISLVRTAAVAAASPSAASASPSALASSEVESFLETIVPRVCLDVLHHTRGIVERRAILIRHLQDFKHQLRSETSEECKVVLRKFITHINDQLKTDECFVRETLTPVIETASKCITTITKNTT